MLTRCPKVLHLSTTLNPQGFTVTSILLGHRLQLFTVVKAEALALAEAVKAVGRSNDD